MVIAAPTVARHTTTTLGDRRRFNRAVNATEHQQTFHSIEYRVGMRIGVETVGEIVHLPGIARFDPRVQIVKS